MAIGGRNRHLILILVHLKLITLGGTPFFGLLLDLLFILLVRILLQGSGYISGFDDLAVLLLLRGRLLLLLLLGRLAAVEWLGGRRRMMLGKDCVQVQVPVGVQREDLLDELGLESVESPGGG